MDTHNTESAESQDSKLSSGLAGAPLDRSAIPEDLRALPQWVVWKNEQKKDGESTKVPYNARTGDLASTINPDTWAVFAWALAQAESGERYNGIGFVLAEGDPFAGIDLDSCRNPETGEVSPWAREIIADLSSYSEVSPTGYGVHIFVRGVLPPGRHVKVISGVATTQTGKPPTIELYDRKRYLTVTGHRLPDAPLTIEDRQEKLAALHHRLFGEHSAESTDAPATAPLSSVKLDFAEPPSETDRLLAERILSEHPAILRSWELDDSKGDCAFACETIRRLLQTLGPQVEDVDLMRAADRVFRASPLYAQPDRQKKWTRSATNYAALTLGDAIEKVRAAKSSESGDFQLDAYRDAAHARELARLLSGQIRWVPEMGAWVEWAERVWRKALEGRVLVIASQALQVAYSDRLAGAKTSVERNELAKKVVEACMHARLSGTLRFLAGRIEVLSWFVEFDQDPWLFNVQNGTLDLRTLTLHPHNPNDRLMKIAAVAYDPAAKSERWERFLTRILPDADVRRYLQRQLGKAMSGSVLEERLDIWWGSGANGKTTLARVMKGLFNDYAKQAATNLLVASTFERHSTEVADLAFSRLVFSSEVDEGKHLAEATIKSLTGGEPKTARFMYKDNFTFPQTFDIVLIVNHKPIITGSDIGMWRRVRLVPFTVQIPEKEQRSQDDLVEELLSDGPAILNWLIDGLRDYQSDRAWVPPSVLAATKIYREAMDQIGRFLGDCCETGPAHEWAVASLHVAYEEWCHGAGEQAKSIDSFGRALGDRGFRSVRRGHSNIRVWLGLRLRQPGEPRGETKGSETVVNLE